jgi:hypothetical protein
MLSENQGVSVLLHLVMSLMKLVKQYITHGIY